MYAAGAVTKSHCGMRRTGCGAAAEGHGEHNHRKSLTIAFSKSIVTA